MHTKILMLFLELTVVWKGKEKEKAKRSIRLPHHPSSHQLL